MTSASPASYVVRAHTIGNGTSVAESKQAEIRFDSSPGQGDELPGPADLLTAAFAACLLKNVERMGELQPFNWREASVEVRSERQGVPPKITRITYRLEIITEEPAHSVDLLHRNIRHHSTIFNTLAAACEVTGHIVATPVHDG